MSTDSTGTGQAIVLIHGLWLTALSWEHWVHRYSGQGFRVIARSWPGMDGDIDALRADTALIDNLGLTEITDYYARIITSLDRPPIIMGHSYGGLITQLLLDRGLGAAVSDPGTGHGLPRRGRLRSPCLRPRKR